MRTTLTIDPGVARELDRLRRTSGRSLERVVNDLLRAGLAHRHEKQPESPSEGEAPTDPVSCGGLRVPAEEFAAIGNLLARLDESPEPSGENTS